MVPAGVIVAVAELAAVGDVVVARKTAPRRACVSAPVRSAMGCAPMRTTSRARTASARTASVRCTRVPPAGMRGTCRARTAPTLVTTTSCARLSTAGMTALRGAFGWSMCSERQT